MLDDKKILKKNKNMVSRVIAGETILLPITRSSKEINAIYSLNRSAAHVWGLIDGKRSLADIKNDLMKEFDVTSSEVEKKIGKLVRELKDINALVGKEAWL